MTDPEYLDLPGTGRVRITTSQDIQVLADRRAAKTTRPRVITASAARLGESESEVARMQRQGWQAQALYYARIVPELSFASQFYAKMMRNMLIYPALLQPDGTAERIEDDLPVRILNRIQDPGGGIQGILGSFGNLAFITGEGQLFGRNLNTEDERWQYVWNDEILVDMGAGNQPRTLTWRPTQGSDAITYEWGSEAISYRFWTPDPGRSGEAWSPMRASLQVAGELVALTDAVMATAMSRITQGIFVIPQDLAPAPAEGGSDEDPLMEPFMEDLVEHLRSAKENVGTPEAAAPFVLSGAYDQLDQIRMIQLHDTQNDYAERELRREAVERLAQGLDMPKEMLTGVGQTNHWAAKQIMDDRWRSHGSELGQQFCSNLNQAYFRPALREAGWSEWRRTVIAKDDSQIIQPADMLDAAKEAFHDGSLTWDGLSHYLNIDLDYMPTPEQRQEIYDFLNKQGVSTNGSAPDPSAGPPPPGPEGDSGRRTRVVASADLNGGYERERGAAEIALFRCREVAGNRIRNRERGCAEGVAAQQVAAKVGTEGLARLGLEPRALVKGGSDLLRPLLTEMGYSTSHADAFCETVEAYATKTLLEETVSLPSHLAANLALVREEGH